MYGDEAVDTHSASKTQERSGFIGFALFTAERDSAATECRLKCVVWKQRADLFLRSEEDFQCVPEKSKI